MYAYQAQRLSLPSYFDKVIETFLEFGQNYFYRPHRGEEFSDNLGGKSSF